MRDVIVGTAGHIDHGKTALVKALTGIDTDRLEEEKRRGITIDIGFAHMCLGDYRIGFIDVPGHEKFVKNMLAGIGGIEIAILVVAANESVMPQTVEHFAICRLLEIPRGLVAITKRDLVDPDLIEVVQEEIHDLVQGSFLEGAPVVAVDSISGAGLDDLKSALLQVIRDHDLGSGRSGHVKAAFRMPIDRVFSVKGFGTVVTGTPSQGQLQRDAAVAVYPSGRIGKVRGIEIFKEPAPVARAGQRAALNLTGLEKQDLERGMVLAPLNTFEPSATFDVMLRLLPGAGKPLKHRAPVRLHHGSAELVGRVYLLGQPNLAPGQEAPAQLRLDTPTIACVFDHFILRSYSPVTTIGGGVILDSAPSRKRNLSETLSALSALSTGSYPDLLLYLIKRKKTLGVDVHALRARTGLLTEAIMPILTKLADVVIIPQDPPLAVHKPALDLLKAQLVDHVKNARAANPLSPGVPREELRTRFLPHSSPAYLQYLLDELQATKQVAVSGSNVLPYGAEIGLTGGQGAIREVILREIAQAGYQPPTFDELLSKLPYPKTEARSVYHFLLQRGELVKVTSELVMSSEQIQRLKDKLRSVFQPGQPFSVADFKDLLNISRKYAIPYLEYLDRERVTRRAGDKRILL
ncbi:MAG: selenocysteine-specific translation elongation factor [Acidobacteriota bacterium]